MTQLRSYLWLILLLSAVAVDFAARLAFAFEMRRVALFEAGLFVALSILLLVMAKRYESSSAVIRRIENWLTVIFGLATIRSGLWAAEIDVAAANLVALAVGLIGLIGYKVWKRVSAGRSRAT